MKTIVEIERNSEPRPLGPFDWAVKWGGKTVASGNSETFLGAVAQAAFVGIDNSTGEAVDIPGLCGLSEAEGLAKLHGEYWQMAMRKARKEAA